MRIKVLLHLWWKILRETCVLLLRVNVFPTRRLYKVCSYLILQIVTFVPDLKGLSPNFASLFNNFNSTNEIILSVCYVMCFVKVIEKCSLPTFLK